MADMAETKAESDDSGGWGSWGSWYTSAKNKSVEVLEFVKRDLDEFSTAVKSEATNVTSSLKEKLKLDEPDSTAGSMKRSVSSFLGQMSQVLNPSPEDEDEEALIINESEPVQLTKFQIMLHTLILNPDTFLVEPDETQCKQYRAWRDIIDEQLSVERLTKLLTASPDLHKQYTALVPDQVSHVLFWERYLFRKALLEDEEAQREALRRRAEREKQEAESFQWLKDEAIGGFLELSEEQQIHLLTEYQKECELKKTTSKQNEKDMASNIDDNHYAAQSTDEASATSEAIADLSVKPSETKGQSSSSSLGESNDDDWEREFDLSDIGTADPTNEAEASSIPK